MLSIDNFPVKHTKKIGPFNETFENRNEWLTHEKVDYEIYNGLKYALDLIEQVAISSIAVKVNV